MQCIIREAAEIKLHPNNMKREDSFCLRKSRKPFIRSLKDCRKPSGHYDKSWFQWGCMDLHKLKSPSRLPSPPPLVLLTHLLLVYLPIYLLPASWIYAFSNRPLYIPPASRIHFFSQTGHCTLLEGACFLLVHLWSQARNRNKPMRTGHHCPSSYTLVPI
jgi:hypothetical protein